MNWNDGTAVRANAECTTLTYYNTVSRTWFFGAAQMGVNSPFGVGYAPAYVKFFVWNHQLARWVGVDQDWRYIPQAVLGLSYANVSWPYGQGTFSVYAQFWHAGYATGLYQVGYMRWYNGICFNY